MLAARPSPDAEAPLRRGGLNGYCGFVQRTTPTRSRVLTCRSGHSSDVRDKASLGAARVCVSDIARGVARTGRKRIRDRRWPTVRRARSAATDHAEPELGDEAGQSPRANSSGQQRYSAPLASQHRQPGRFAELGDHRTPGLCVGGAPMHGQCPGAVLARLAAASRRCSARLMFARATTSAVAAQARRSRNAAAPISARRRGAAAHLPVVSRWTVRRKGPRELCRPAAAHVPLSWRRRGLTPPASLRRWCTLGSFQPGCARLRAPAFNSARRWPALGVGVADHRVVSNRVCGPSQTAAALRVGRGVGAHRTQHG